MIYEVTVFCTDDEGIITPNTTLIKALSKEDALEKYNKLAVDNSWVGMDCLDNVKELKLSI